MFSQYQTLQSPTIMLLCSNGLFGGRGGLDFRKCLSLSLSCFLSSIHARFPLAGDILSFSTER